METKVNYANEPDGRGIAFKRKPENKLKMVRAAAANGQFSNQGRVSSNVGRIISFLLNYNFCPFNTKTAATLKIIFSTTDQRIAIALQTNR